MLSRCSNKPSGTILGPSLPDYLPGCLDHHLGPDLSGLYLLDLPLSRPVSNCKGVNPALTLSGLAISTSRWNVPLEFCGGYKNNNIINFSEGTVEICNIPKKENERVKGGHIRQTETSHGNSLLRNYSGNNLISQNVLRIYFFRNMKKAGGIVMNVCFSKDCWPNKKKGSDLSTRHARLVNLLSKRELACMRFKPNTFLLKRNRF